LIPLNNEIQLLRQGRQVGPNLRGAGTVLKHQAAFTDALRAGRKMRKHIFDTIEKRHAYDLGNDRRGKGLYEVLLLAVRDSGVPEAAEEFEDRFLPLLNADRHRSESHPASREEMIKHRGWVWVSAVCVAAVLGTLILGLNAFKMIAAARPTVIEPPMVAKATEPASETLTEPLPAMAAEVPIPGANAIQSGSKTTTESTQQ
jgi:hypothetical protein